MVKLRISIGILFPPPLMGFELSGFFLRFAGFLSSITLSAYLLLVSRSLERLPLLTTSFLPIEFPSFPNLRFFFWSNLIKRFNWKSRSCWFAVRSSNLAFAFIIESFSIFSRSSSIETWFCKDGEPLSYLEDGNPAMPIIGVTMSDLKLAMIGRWLEMRFPIE